MVLYTIKNLLHIKDILKTLPSSGRNIINKIIYLYIEKERTVGEGNN